MTKEYITKNRAKQFVCGHCNEVCREEPCEPSDCDWMAFIDKEPAADVVPMVHGRWIEKKRHMIGGSILNALIAESKRITKLLS